MSPKEDLQVCDVNKSRSAETDNCSKKVVEIVLIFLLPIAQQPVFLWLDKLVFKIFVGLRSRKWIAMLCPSEKCHCVHVARKRFVLVHHPQPDFDRVREHFTFLMRLMVFGQSPVCVVDYLGKGKSVNFSMFLFRSFWPVECCNLYLTILVC